MHQHYIFTASYFNHNSFKVFSYTCFFLLFFIVDYKPINCGKPPEMEYAFVKFTRTDYLADATYTCQTGETYTLVCKENSKWNHPNWVCKKPLDCGQPPLLGFAGVDYKETSFNSTATYKCLMGEKYKVVCKEDGKWSKPSGLCRSKLILATVLIRQLINVTVLIRLLINVTVLMRLFCICRDLFHKIATLGKNLS